MVAVCYHSIGRPAKISVIGGAKGGVGVTVHSKRFLLEPCQVSDGLYGTIQFFAQVFILLIFWFLLVLIWTSPMGWIPYLVQGTGLDSRCPESEFRLVSMLPGFYGRVAIRKTQAKLRGWNITIRTSCSGWGTGTVKTIYIIQVIDILLLVFIGPSSEVLGGVITLNIYVPFFQAAAFVISCIWVIDASPYVESIVMLGRRSWVERSGPILHGGGRTFGH